MAQISRTGRKNLKSGTLFKRQFGLKSLHDIKKQNKNSLEFGPALFTVYGFLMSTALFSAWQKDLLSLGRQKQTRMLQIPQGLDFCSNDYLSLSQHPSIRKALIKALKSREPTGNSREPTGTRLLPLSAGSSRLIRGHTPYHEETENIFQKWVQRESALFFSSGYMANMGLIQALPKNVALFSDQLNHASLIDGCRLSRLPCHIYPHKDTNYLESLLKKEKKRMRVIVTESLFSMDGDFAPIEELSELAGRYQALLVIDEAHATGIHGHRGRGLFSLLKSQDNVVTVHPCGKALSASGAFVAGPSILKKYLINKARTFIYNTAPAPIVTVHIKYVLNTLRKEPKRRESLKKKALFFRKLMEKSPFGTALSESAIVPVVLGSSEKALACERYLKTKGLNVRAIRWPTVPKGQARLRICLHYNHTYRQLRELAFWLKEWTDSHF